MTSKLNLLLSFKKKLPTSDTDDLRNTRATLKEHYIRKKQFSQIKSPFNSAQVTVLFVYQTFVSKYLISGSSSLFMSIFAGQIFKDIVYLLFFLSK